MEWVEVRNPGSDLSTVGKSSQYCILLLLVFFHLWTVTLYVEDCRVTAGWRSDLLPGLLLPSGPAALRTVTTRCFMVTALWSLSCLRSCLLVAAVSCQESLFVVACFLFTL
jgi:hypothetical protein